ncbi:thiamine biosynthesis lipoprotein [Lewinella marina]|uniref:FAD:protein FMN transferase n=1 Tax=Neolewinella marina TaxID=438751 RepID=A0A2G0CJM6_9BACT|nr:FAD:protein FMN transferase [Neolewinella marina]NJB84654.1 thiamine biosynthesis lipoprotein [Neolewinella marina]PHL00174.1 hypothetical protein CGL56_03795 [Neolewinella marina]
MPYCLSLLLCLLPLSLAAQHRLTVSRAAMGTPWSITVVTSDTAAARNSIELAYARIEEIEQSMSDYRADSEINRLVRQAPRRWHPVSDDLYRVLTFSRQLARRSGGAFDPTVGPLTKIWRRALRQGVFPADSTVAAARSRVQWKDVRLRRAGRVWLARDDLELDLGGVAKGYALDAAAALLRRAGLHSYLIDGGGDLLLGEPPPGTAGWRIATPTGSLDTSRVAVATSGSRYRYLEKDGRRYSHLVDPRTGLGVTDPRSVTVIAPTGLLADGLASTLSVTGEAGGQSVMRSYPNVIFYWSDPEE